MFNQFKTIILLGVLTGILLLIGQVVGGTSGLTIAFLFAIIMNVGSYWFSDKIVLRMYRAKEVSKVQAPKIHAMVEDICKKAHLPKPKIYIVPTDNANAFATGRNPQNAAIAFTEGILRLLSEKELKGVAAHELAHVKNRDTLISTIAATIASVISYIAFMARFAAIFGGRDNEGMGNILELLLLAIVAPIAAVIIQLAISRSREYLADQSGASYLKDGSGLASALEKLHSHKTPMRLGNPSSSHLMIANNFSGRALLSLFSTHPNHNDRISKLKSLKF
jgi:heat shock protein HtpX|tara:strand:+ start:17671 stop:18507 length:837 start_codon:yes stop_codon:yes gene_type:complete